MKSKFYEMRDNEMTIDLSRIELLDIKVMIENTLIEKNLDVDHEKDLQILKMKVITILNQ